VKLSQAGSGEEIQTNPLPAIFPPELGLSATTQGRKGVLHTVWAKKRLSVLQEEIEIEMKNGEGVGLEMAMQEKQWIEDNFGVGAKVIPDLQYTTSPTTPKTPGSGRLSEKLKGLKLGTSASELGPSGTFCKTKKRKPDWQFIEATQPGFDDSHPMSPDLGDIAVSSFSQFRGGAPRLARIVSKGHARNNSRINSIDAIAGGQVVKDDTETEEGLFAVKMSPRSPEMTKSPFSFTSKHTAPWVKGNEWPKWRDEVINSLDDVYDFWEFRGQRVTV
jgi:hypothetical protein